MLSVVCVHSSTTHLLPHQTFCLLKGSQSEERNLRGKELKQLFPDRSCSGRLDQDAIILNRESCKDTFSGKHKENMEMIIIGLV